MSDSPPELPSELSAAVRKALGYSEQASWERAGRAWAELIDLALDHRHVDLAREAAGRAVDALRRDDRPAASLSVLRRAIDLADDRDGKLLQQVQLSACLVDAGHPDLAEQVGREALAMTEPGPLRALAADTLAGVLIARGDVLGLRGVVAQLRHEARGVGVISANFREAQLDRLDGRLGLAEDRFQGCVEDLEGHPRAEGARASAFMELGELALIVGDPESALEHFNAASAAWSRAGRRAGLLLAEAGRVHAALASGATTFLPGLLDDPVAYAEDRGLPVLEARLRLARGLSRTAAGSEAAKADLDAAILLADAAGVPQLAGRIRLERHRWGLCNDLDELQLAGDQLVGNQPWFCRAELAYARAIAATDPADAMRRAARVLCRFKGMGLDEDAAMARELCGDVSC
ncbi:MAG: hypothetical protein H6741_08655 [Alphaproteobacteria bacterium]|nr:hypothetical protein [Alphaproteobacteria bacterium]